MTLLRQCVTSFDEAPDKISGFAGSQILSLLNLLRVIREVRVPSQRRETIVNSRPCTSGITRFLRRYHRQSARKSRGSAP
jgi:hypothetical protein